MALLCSSGAGREAGAGLAPRGWFGALRAEPASPCSSGRSASLHNRLASATHVAASGPRLPSRCAGLGSSRRWDGLGAWPFSAAFAAAEIGLAPSPPRAPAARAGTFEVVAVPGCLRSTDDRPTNLLPRRSRWAGVGRRLSKPRQVLCGGGVRGRACLSWKSVHRRLIFCRRAAPRQKAPPWGAASRRRSVGAFFCEFTPDPDAKRLQGNPEGAQRQEPGPCPSAAPVKKPKGCTLTSCAGLGTQRKSRTAISCAGLATQKP